MKFNKTAVIAAATSLVIAGGGAAYAYWTTTGGGTVSATMAPDDGSSVTLTTGPIAALKPGVTATVDIKAAATGADATIENVSFDSVTITEAPDVTGTCQSDWFTTTVTGNPANTTVVKDAPAVTLPQKLTMTMANLPTVNQDACKGAAITVALTTP